MCRSNKINQIFRCLLSEEDICLTIINELKLIRYFKVPYGTSTSCKFAYSNKLKFLPSKRNFICI